MCKSDDNNLKYVSGLEGEFFIPSYQRGYRWGKRQVTELLDDILEFKTRMDDKKDNNSDEDKNDEEIYCLQPLVVKKEIIESKERYRVIDGQQRLTTLFLILGYLKNSGLIEDVALKNSIPEYHIEYESREGSRDFLNDLINGKVDSDKKMEYIDYFYMANVYEAAEDWIKKNITVDIEDYLKILLNKACFIWYPTEADENVTFGHLNEKISLTGAELIKAMFLNRSNYEDGSKEVLPIRQREIALKWDMIEYSLQNDEFWLFVYPANDWNSATRIDYIFDFICETDFYKKEIDDKLIGNDKFRAFRYFDRVFKEEKNNKEKEYNWILEYWKKIEEIYDVFLEWYNDYELYHYVGYLITVWGKDSFSNLKELLQEWFDSNSKKQFIEKVIAKISEKLKTGTFLKDVVAIRNKEVKDKNVASQKWYRYIFDNGDNSDRDGSYKKQSCRDLLLLHNIETIVLRNRVLVENAKKEYNLPNFTRFPFHLYKKESWQIEHISSNSGDDIRDDNRKNQIIYLWFVREKGILDDISFSETPLKERERIKATIDGLFSDEKLIELFNDPDKMKDASNDPKNQCLNELSSVVKELQELSFDDRVENLNTIGNYTLLDQETNGTYQNHIFAIKRIFINLKEQGKKPKIIESKFSPEKDENGNEIIDENGKKKWTLDLHEEFASAFFPPCTMDVFGKKYNNEVKNFMQWTQQDANAYVRDIRKKIEIKFMKPIDGLIDDTDLID